MFTIWFGASAAPSDSQLIGPLRHLPAVEVERAADCAWAISTNAEYARHRGTGVRAWVWARIDSARALGSSLGLAEATAAELVVAGYLRWGPRLPAHLTGDFSVCIHDPRSNEIHSFRDPIGVRPLTVATAGASTVVTTAPGVLWRLPGFIDQPDPDTITQHAVGARWLSMQAAHPQGRRVTPGCLLSVRDGDFTETIYHRFDPVSSWSSKPNEQWVEDFRSVLAQAVAHRVPVDGPIGIEFSGGLDSVGIAAVLHDLHPRHAARMRALASTYFANEESAIRAAAEDLGIEHLTIDGRGSREQERDWRCAVEEILGAPLSHDIAAWFASGLAACQAAGGQVIFAGFGGDEGVTSLAKEAPQEWWRHRAFLSAARYALPRHTGWRNRASVARSIIFGPKLPKVEPPSVQQLGAALNLRPAALTEAGIAEQIAQEIGPTGMTSVNATIVRPDGTLQPSTAAYWSRRAEECSTVASLFEMSYAFPLLDPAVLQQYLSTPTIHKFRHGLGRYLFREAVGPTMPSAARWAPSKHMGPPVVRESKHPRTENPPIHPLLAQIMQPGAPLPGAARAGALPGMGSRNYVRRVNIWLHQQFPLGT